MRDHGCYMYARTRNRDTHEEVEVEQIRHWMGDFAAITNGIYITHVNGVLEKS